MNYFTMTIKEGFKISVCIVFLMLLLSSCSPKTEKIYIAHGGGKIDGIEYTNSKEAVENALAKGMTYIELDLALTSDSVLVSLHDWYKFRSLTNNSVLNDKPLSLQEFKKSKIAGKFTPLTADDIKDLLIQHPQMHLVTDKISDPLILNEYFSEFSDRVMVECFSTEDYYALKKLGYHVFRSSPPVARRNYMKTAIKNFPQGGVDHFICSLEEFENDVSADSSKKFLDKTQKNLEIAIYTCADKKEADKIFKLYPEIKYIYIDSCE